MSSIASLRRKDNMWIYKNPQGLQVLNDELNQRRKKRSSRHRHTTPPLSPTTLEPIIHISKINHVLQRPPSPPEEPATNIVKAEEQKMQQSIANVKSREEKNVKRLSVITNSVQEKKDAIMKRSSVVDKDMGRVDRVIVPRVASPPARVASPPVRIASPPARVVYPPVRVDSPPVKVTLPPARVNSPPARVISPPARVSSPPARVMPPPARVMPPPARVTSPPIQTLSTSKSTTSPMSTPEKNFLLEAKRKLFSVQQQQQQQQNVAGKNLPVAPAKKNRIVSSFISAFETTPPPKPPRHVITPAPATSSVSTPLNAAVVETIIPVTSCSSVIPTESYFSEVIDRRFSPTPAETTEEEPIIVYLPQLSPDMSFCTNALDIPQQLVDQKRRPCIKKQVSFSDQLSTFIPDNQSIEEEENVTTFVRTLSNELSDVISTVQQTQQHREKFIPVLPQKKEVPVFQKKEVQPQKLSNKLLDIFQKKPKVMMVHQPTSSSKELTHLTKTRAKPPSLKKPTMLAYPAAIAQPDWRTRAITTNKSSVFI